MCWTTRLSSCITIIMATRIWSRYGNIIMATRNNYGNTTIMATRIGTEITIIMARRCMTIIMVTRVQNNNVCPDPVWRPVMKEGIQTNGLALSICVYVYVYVYVYVGTDKHTHKYMPPADA